MIDNEFTNIDVDISPKDQDFLVCSFVREILQPASLNLFEQVLIETDDVQTAVYQALLNEQVLRALQAKIDQGLAFGDDCNQI